MKVSNLAKSYIADYSAAGAVAAYFALQTQIPNMPDLPVWAVVTLMILAVVRGMVLQFLTDKDGDGVPDGPTPEGLAAALVEATADIDEAKALVEKHQKKEV